MNGTVKYWGVGRNNAKGEFEFKNLSMGEVEVLIEKKVSKYLLSSQVDACNGTIWVGLMRPVGKYKVKVKA